MTNAEISSAFAEIAEILEIQGANPFRIRAYQRAASVIAQLPQDLAETYREGGAAALDQIPGIGQDLGKKIIELLKTGELKFLNRLEAKVPAGVLEIMQVEGMGPKRTTFVWKRFGVKSVAQLEKLAKSGKLNTLKGWGDKSVANILAGIRLRESFGDRLPLGLARPMAEQIERALRSSRLCSKIAIAGSTRRWKETVGDLDFLVTSRQPARVVEFFCSLPQTKRIVAKGPGKATVVLATGIEADLRVLKPDEFGAGLIYFTGSKEHNLALRRLAIQKQMTISEYGIFRGTAKRRGKRVAAATEAEMYEALGLPYLEPELREDQGEIALARRGELPKLVTAKQIRGDLHMHSEESDGHASLEELVRAAKRLGRDYIAITDHASVMGMVKGMKPRTIAAYRRRVERAARAASGLHVLVGAEVDILKDGSLYLPDAALAKLDWVVASVHAHFKMTRAQMTKRLIRAIEHPAVNLLGHPFTRQLTRRGPIDFDLDAVLQAAKKHHVAVELNSTIFRLDLPDVALRRAKAIGTKIAITSDAHYLSELDLRYGVGTARRGWLEKSDVINALTWTQFQRWRQSK
jgi:DNA polymerase (family 10)